MTGQPTTCQAVLLDMDGVVVDTEQSVAEFWRELARSEGRSISPEELAGQVHGRRAEYTLEVLFPDIPPARYGEVYERLRANNESQRYTAITGVLAVIRQLRAAGIPLALVTGAQPWKVDAVLDQLGVAEAFDVLVHADDVPEGKPDPACYRLAARRLGVDIGRCLVFEDAVSGITSAVTAGARCVALAPPHRTAEVRAAGATGVVRDFSAVAFAAPERMLRIGSDTEIALGPANGAPDVVPPPVDGWNPAVAGRLAGRDEVVHRAHLVGADPALTRQGGGNFSVKTTAVDHCGRRTRVLWMSAWGCDGATATDGDFPALRLDELLTVRHDPPMTESDMVYHLLACGLHGEQPRPGIETLTHAFIPAAHVDHCHPDAVIALTACPAGRELADAEFGDEAIWFDYRQFDVDVARELADRIAATPACRFVLLANHGLFTWAQTSEQCYRNSLEAVDRARTALGRAIDGPADLGGRAVDPLPERAATDVLVEVLPALRGELSSGGSAVLHVDRAAETIEFASSARGPRLAMRGPGCPDSLATVGYRPLVLDPVRTADAAASRAVLSGVRRHRQWYDDYYARHITDAGRALQRRDNAPRTVLFPGIGVVSTGPDAASARLRADHFGQTMSVVRAADAAGGYTSLSEAQGVADEYWPLIRLKPQLRAAAGRLAGQVFLVAGADDEDTARIADRLAVEDGHVAMAGADPHRLAAAAEDISRRHGERRAAALPSTLDQPRQVARDAVLAYGGFDVLLAGDRPDGLVPAALPVLARQGRGGAVLLVDAERTDGAPDIAETGPLPPGVTVNTIGPADPAAVAAAAAFFATTNNWTGTVLRPCRPGKEKVA
ncbi:MAG TPA: HAD-IA family hydrolase [Pseudonocardiaceae bacterium]|nr:HAD-IA family hydrolase [Pseudonocardiaceae bacterium]